MDPFPDFGLFELVAATGIAWLARQIYSRRWLGHVVVVVSVVAPVALVFLADAELVRWVAAVALASGLVNAGYIFPQLRGQSREGIEDGAPMK